MKVCSKCSIEKPEEEFLVRKKDALRKRRADCKTCQSLRAKNYKQKLKTQINEGKLTQRKCAKCSITKVLTDFHSGGTASWCKYCTKRDYYKRAYNITQEDYTTLFNKQKGKCALCKNIFTETAHIDHCHTTNKVRGLLCFNCNSMLGTSKENVKTLLAAITYLKRNK